MGKYQQMHGHIVLQNKALIKNESGRIGDRHKARFLVGRGGDRWVAPLSSLLFLRGGGW